MSANPSCEPGDDPLERKENKTFVTSAPLTSPYGLMRRILFGGFVLFTVLLAAQNKPKLTKVKTAAPAAPAYGNSDSITEYEMKIYDYFLASDQLEGRNLPSRGYDTAALYVASHLAEWGLKPGGSLTGTNGPLQPYLMPFEQSVGHRCGRRRAWTRRGWRRARWK